MKAFLPLLSILLCLPLLHAQPLNDQDPAAVAKHYLQACERWDAEAAAQVVSTPAEAKALGNLGTEIPPEFEQLLMELLCVPITKHVAYEMGEVATTGDECRIKVTATYTIPETLVLKRAPDGTWKLALEETIVSTTGGTKPEILRLGDEAQGSTCLSNLKQICLGILMYAQDHDEVLPPADKWVDEIMPYLKNELVFKCPAAPDLQCAYAFNAALSKMPLGRINNPAETIVVFESNLGTRNAHGNPTDLPNPARHNDGNNFGYVDGNCKWLQAQ
ncbi:MAG: hypothetical protein ABFD96_15240 [Armatimonadia bacterium]